jgi:hypothetical protein
MPRPGFTFKRIPKAMMRAAIKNANKMLNQFPAKNSVSDTLSPLTIMTGRPTPDYNDMKIEFGANAQDFEKDNNPTNTPKARTTGAIAMTLMGNAQGGYFFLSLATGRKLSRQQWGALPMPDGVVAAVKPMAQPGRMATTNWARSAFVRMEPRRANIRGCASTHPNTGWPRKRRHRNSR